MCLISEGNPRCDMPWSLPTMPMCATAIHPPARSEGQTQSTSASQEDRQSRLLRCPRLHTSSAVGLWSTCTEVKRASREAEVLPPSKPGLSCRDHGPPAWSSKYSQLLASGSLRHHPATGCLQAEHCSSRAEPSVGNFNLPNVTQANDD